MEGEKNMDFYGFYTGKIFDAYEYLGAHYENNGTVFRVFAPGALRISLIGEFNGWQEYGMNKTYDGNFWECRVDNARPGMMYKYRVYDSESHFIDHCDPYGFGMELRPHNASIIREMGDYCFQDMTWMSERSACKNKPLNIYEVHFGSFRKPGESPEDWYSYEEMANLLIPYLKEKGYNLSLIHI